MNFFKKIFTSNKVVSTKPHSKTEITEELSENKPNEFYGSNFEAKYRDKPFYIHKYCRMDGEWIEAGEKILIIRIDKVYGHTFMSVLIKAEKSGVLEWTLAEDQLLSNGTKMYNLYNKGEYENENSINKTEFKHIFYINEPKHTFGKWFKSDGDFVEKGEAIYEFKTLNSKTHIHKAEKQGFIDIKEPDKIYSLEKNELLYIIRTSDEKRIQEKFINEPDIIIDEFNNSTIIKWNRVSSKFSISNGVCSKSNNYITDFIFSFIYFQNNDYIVFSFNPKQIKPKQNDKINFLFENNEQIEFELSGNSISSRNRLNEKIFEYKSLITESELNLFANVDFKKWKITLSNDEKEILGGEIGGDKNYESKNNLNIVIKKYTQEYLKLIKENVQNYQPLMIRNGKKTNEKKLDICFVYLMNDTSNGYYKIGISNKPKYREKTLQSEKPTIEMVISKKYPIRKIAESFEKSLHKAYANKRIRGEWFELDETDVEHITESLK